jgi:hypothetical protein
MLVLIAIVCLLAIGVGIYSAFFPLSENTPFAEMAACHPAKD